MGHPDLSRPRTDLTEAARPTQQAVAEGAEHRLRCNAYLALKNVSCEFREGVLTLRGCLPTYYLKQMAQTEVARVAGVQRVVNEIEVVAPCPLSAGR
jgi:osmotically-inducible protein OsmY